VILAGDVGGTKTNLGFFDIHGDRLVSLAEERYPSGDYKRLDLLVAAFVGRYGYKAQSACFGVAGPVHRGRCQGVNLPWIVDASVLSRNLEIPEVHVINDLESTAFSLSVLARRDVVTLSSGARGAVGNAAVIAAGTGLGEAGLYWDGHRHQPFACEGGHTDFGPRDALEIEFLAYLAQRYEHVSVERIVSGAGLVDLYHFFYERAPQQACREVHELVQTDQGPAAVSRAALERRCPVCETALDRFVMIYGAEAGNLALKLMATGGVYVGGGIAPKIIAKLKERLFLEAFLAKGRMRGLLMERIPVRVIMTDRAALLGAAQYARLRCQSQ